MKPFMFQFREDATEQGPDFSSLWYDSKLNLTVDSRTGKPAVTSLHLATETFTKADMENSDTDRSGNVISFGTQTQTYADAEGGDSDQDSTIVRMVLGTSTETRQYLESSDQD